MRPFRQRRVDLHCHSSFSDGTLSPEELAGALVEAGARQVALTDHNTTAGLARFRAAAEARGLRTTNGVEIDTLAPSGPLHVLALGFDEADAPLQKALASIRSPHVAMLSGSLAGRANLARPLPSGQGALPLNEVCRLVHQAGGITLAAHPLAGLAGIDELERHLPGWRESGLDGIEVHYGPYGPETREALRRLARREGLLAGAGSDFHGPRSPLGPPRPGVDLPDEDWRALAGALGWAGEGFLSRLRHPGERDWRSYLLHIALPALLAGVLFLLAIFGGLLPLLEEQLLERRKETTRELTRVAASILQEYADEERGGRLDGASARREAARRVGLLRYGPEGKDYFWITDLRPVMVMHPWRPDLDGKDVSQVRDPEGRRVFVEFVRAVRAQGSGFVAYSWQWKDDPRRVAPKLSHVQLFRPWGWVVGTGLYTRDVEAEMARVRGRFIWASLGIAALVGLLMLQVLRRSLALETRRAAAERDLRHSREKYRSLAEASGAGSLLVLDGDCVFATRAVEELLGEAPGALAGRRVADLVAADAPPGARQWLEAWLEGQPADERRIVPLRRSGGESLPTELTASPTLVDGRPGLVLSVHEAERDHPGGPVRRWSPAASGQWSLHLQELRGFLLEPLGEKWRPLPELPHDQTAVQAARRMTSAGSTALLVTDDEGLPLGLVTDSDLRERWAAAGAAAERRLGEIMSSPLITLPGDAPAWQAVQVMRSHGIGHLVVLGEDGRPLGLLRDRDLVHVGRFGTIALFQELRQAADPVALGTALARLPGLLDELAATGARGRLTTGLVGHALDQATERVLELALDRLGQPPAPFAWLALGSQGRREPTLLSDQDSALVYADPDPSRARACREWFLELGRLVCAELEAAGLRPCPGGVMASQAAWCRPLAEWRQILAEWMADPRPRILLDLHCMLDMRPLGASSSHELAAALREAWRDATRAHPSFLPQLALGVLRQRTSLGLRGQLLLHGQTADGRRALDLKELLAPVVSTARLYALRDGLAETGTLERLDGLREAGRLGRDLHAGLAASWEAVSALRLARQARALAEGEEASNLLVPGQWNAEEEALLRHLASLTGDIKKKLSYDVLGTA